MNWKCSQERKEKKVQWSRSEEKSAYLLFLILFNLHILADLAKLSTAKDLSSDKSLI